MRVGRVESFVPDRDLLLERLLAADDLDGVKAVVAELIDQVGRFVYAYNERTGERVMGMFGLSGGGGVFFTNTDERGVVVNRTSTAPVVPTPDRISTPVSERQEAARAARVAVGKKE